MASAFHLLIELDKLGLKLSPEVKEKWLDALRSGNYRQTDNYLCKNGEYCCLGVLAEVNNIPSTSYRSSVGIISSYQFENQPDADTMLPDGSFGLSEQAMGILADLNDNYGKSFDDIADIVEKHL